MLGKIEERMRRNEFFYKSILFYKMSSRCRKLLTGELFGAEVAQGCQVATPRIYYYFMLLLYTSYLMICVIKSIDANSNGIHTLLFSC